MNDGVLPGCGTSATDILHCAGFLALSRTQDDEGSQLKRLRRVSGIAVTVAVALHRADPHITESLRNQRAAIYPRGELRER
jgi:hypothetical protein